MQKTLGLKTKCLVCGIIVKKIHLYWNIKKTSNKLIDTWPIHTHFLIILTCFPLVKVVNVIRASPRSLLSV